MIIKAEGESDRDYDFLSSIELLIFDQTEILLMQVSLSSISNALIFKESGDNFFSLCLQNWDHVLHVMDHLNLQPRDLHETDLSRVRSWAINGWTKYYRQNLIFTAYPLVQISAMVNDLSHNYAGSVRTNSVCTIGIISQVVVPVSQVNFFVTIFRTLFFKKMFNPLLCYRSFTELEENQRVIRWKNALICSFIKFYRNVWII